MQKEIKNQSIINNKKIAIIGAGPVGLTTAKLLQQKGATVAVYERDANAAARIKGGTLDLHKNRGQKALEKAGLLNDYYKLSRPKATRFVNRKGKILIENKPDKNDLYKEPEIDRSDLRNLLLGSLEENTVQWDRKFVSLASTERGYKLHFENGLTEEADIVIGADGGRSKVRKHVTGSEAAYTGSFLILGEAIHPEKECSSFKEMCGEGNMAALAEGKIFYAQTKSSGAISYYVSFRKPENWFKDNNINFNDKTSVISFLTDAFSGWHKNYLDLFLATEEFTGLPMRYMPLEEKWKPHKNITLAGDAAHVMPPFAGIGVEIGLEDAVHISQNLTGGAFQDTAAALADYEKKMFRYAEAAQKKTRKNERWAHSAFLPKVFNSLIPIISAFKRK